jgi:gamma-glutamyltranspeptidase/glutathione hydrolase
MRMYELGGNAIDAGVASALAQAVLEYQDFGFGGEAPILIYSALSRQVTVINGNTRMPAAATASWFHRNGIALIPGDGFLPAGVCAAPDALVTALSLYGRLGLKEVLAPAIELAANGFPMYEGLRDRVVSCESRFRTEWPSSAALFLPNDNVPAIGQIWKNPDLAQTFEKLIEAEHNARSRGRAGALRAARDRFYKGDIARVIVDFQRNTKVRDANGVESSGLLAAEDFAAFETRVEGAVGVNYHGHDVYKCGPWSQGPVFLQQLNLLERFDLRSMGHNSAEYIHAITEVAKLAFADRERYYGDPTASFVPLRGLLSKEYAASRQGLVDLSTASLELRPGNPYRYQGGSVSPEPVLGELQHWQDGTTGTRAADSDGNMFSAAPSGGWFQSSPVIPGLGFSLGTRGQMCRLDDSEHPAALRPRKQPRTTLSPSLVMKDGLPLMVFGSPGGDQQDQWTLQFFLNSVEFGMDVQDAIDAACFHSKHFPSSFYPKHASPGELVVEAGIGSEVVAALVDRGHKVVTVPSSTINWTTAVVFHADGPYMEGGASSRGERHYAIGW